MGVDYGAVPKKQALQVTAPHTPISSSGEGGGIQMMFKGIYSSVPFSKGS